MPESQCPTDTGQHGGAGEGPEGGLHQGVHPHQHEAEAGQGRFRSDFSSLRLRNVTFQVEQDHHLGRAAELPHVLRGQGRASADGHFSEHRWSSPG